MQKAKVVDFRGKDLGMNEFVVHDALTEKVAHFAHLHILTLKLLMG